MQNLNQATPAGFGPCPTPERLVGDVDQRDREWGQWERDAIQAVVNQTSSMLAANYPGKGWFEINLTKAYYSDGSHGAIVYKALYSAFGGKLEGLRNASRLFFSGKNWHIVAKYSEGTLRFLFLPRHECAELGWFARRGWVSPVADISANLDVNAVRVPPSTLRPNRRGVNNHDVDGISTEAGVPAAHAAFPYENLC